MKLIAGYKKELIIFFTLLVFYFTLRFTNILGLPIFTDEAIYIRWAQIAKQDASWRFISLTDGKQPLFIWLEMLIMHFIRDPLLSGRMVSVIAGLATMLGLFFLGKELFKNRWIGLITAGLYVLYPFGLVYDRMALYDSLVGAFSVWAIYLEVLLIRKIRLDIALITGMVIGAAVLNKSSGFATIYFSPLSLILFPFRNKGGKLLLLKWVGFMAIVWVIANVCYTVLRLSPFFHIIKDKDASFIYPVSEWIHHPLAYVVGNAFGYFDWFHTYLTWPVILLIALSFFITRKFWREKLFLLCWFLMPFSLAVLFSRVLYPRYILFMTLPLLPVAAFCIYQLLNLIKNKLIFVLIIIMVLGLWVYADYFIITDIARAPIPQSDLNQYVNEWPAGGGVAESVAFFKEKSLNHHIYIATEGTFGLMPFVYEIYFNNNTNVTVKGFWPIQDTPPLELFNTSKHMPTYIVFYEPCPSCKTVGEAPISWPVHLISRYKKGTGSSYLSVYQFGQ